MRSNSSAALLSSSALSLRRDSFSPRSAKPCLRPSRSAAAVADVAAAFFACDGVAGAGAGDAGSGVPKSRERSSSSPFFRPPARPPNQAATLPARVASGLPGSRGAPR